MSRSLYTCDTAVELPAVARGLGQSDDARVSVFAFASSADEARSMLFDHGCDPDVSFSEATSHSGRWDALTECDAVDVESSAVYATGLFYDAAIVRLDPSAQVRHVAHATRIDGPTFVYEAV